MSVLNADVLNCQTITASGASVTVATDLYVIGSSTGFNIRNAVDPTKICYINNTGPSLATITTTSAANTTFTFPDIDDTLVTIDGLGGSLTNKYFPPGTIDLSMSSIIFGDGATGAFSIGAGSRSAGLGSVSIGYSARTSVSSYATSVGYNAGFSFTTLTDPPNNTLLGYNSGYSNDVGCYYNTAVGSNTLYNNTVYGLIAVGANALQTKTIGFDAIGIGYNALVLCGIPANIVSIGSGSLASATTTSASPSTAIGYNALGVSSSIGDNGTAIGHLSLSSTTAGYRNTAVGKSALALTTVSTNNTAIGSSCLATVNNLTTGDNTAIGASCLTLATTGNTNTAVGFGTLSSVTTSQTNTIIGYNSASAITTNGDLTVIGSASALTSSSNTSVIIGASSAPNLTSTTATCIGYLSGSTLTSGSTATCIGYNAGINVTSNFQNSCFGNGSTASAAGVASQLTLGNGAITSFRCQVSLTVVSDQRDKKDIIPLESTTGLKIIEDMKPVRFIWNTRDGLKKDIPDVGFLAQDLLKTQETLGIPIPGLVYNENPDKLEVTHSKLFPILVKAIQEINIEIDCLTNILDNYEEILVI